MGAYEPPNVRSWNIWELNDAITRPELLVRGSTVSKTCEDLEYFASNLAALVPADFSMMGMFFADNYYLKIITARSILPSYYIRCCKFSNFPCLKTREEIP